MATSLHLERLIRSSNCQERELGEMSSLGRRMVPNGIFVSTIEFHVGANSSRNDELRTFVASRQINTE
jgi:hypothetical protein